jgi:hypothetical protein
LSIDETIQFHEHLSHPIRTLVGTSGILYFAWVIPGFIFVLILGLFLLKFIKSLPRNTRILFIISGFIYLMGAIGMELVGGYIYNSSGYENITYAMVTNLEESLEMIGILIFIYALMRYIETNINELRIYIKE